MRRIRRQGAGIGVVIVDNGSELAARQHLHQELPGVPVLEQGENLGFGAAANAGFRWWMASEAPQFFAVAPHDALPAPGCLDEMIDMLRSRPEIGLASADVGDGRTPVVDPYFGGITRPASTNRGWESADHPHGTLLVARGDCLRDVGLFDERYFAYCEEADLGLRARSAGWEVGLVRGARVENPTIRSGTAAVDYLQHRNTLLLVREHSGRYKAFIRYVIALLDLVRGLTARGPSPPFFVPRARLRALLDHLRGRYGPPPPGYVEPVVDRVRSG